ncbi:MAG: aminotransferase class IV [Pirellulales bacterium]|nr:aminotransferase class IV [Pirellulales bacterium]
MTTFQECENNRTGASRQTGRVVYINGRYVPEAEASISIFDSALMFGDMVFEMTRSFNRVQFKLREHLERLYRSVKTLRIPFAMPVEELESLAHEVIDRNRPFMDADDEDRLMINVSRGPLSIYHPVLGGDPGPTLVISDFPLSLTMGAVGHLYDEGVHAVIPSQRAVPAELIDPKMKNRSRLHYMMANIQVALTGDPHAWALLLDPDGFVTEGTGANFFIVVGGELWTPEPRNILRGISRRYAMDLASGLGITVREKNIESYDVIHAEEAFFTATPFSILPCTRLDGEAIGTGRTGPVTQQLLSVWSDSVGLDIVEQAKRFSARNAQTANNSPNPYRFNRAEDDGGIKDRGQI